MKIKTSELIDAALDWAVATVQKLPIRRDPMGIGDKAGTYWVWPEGWPVPEPGYMRIGRSYSPSTNWDQGGPIIERIKGFQFKNWLESKPETCCEAQIHNYEGDWIAFGPTPLIAAMRCYCCSKLGDVVDIPEELCQQQKS